MKSADEILAEHGIKLESPAPGRYYAICPRCSHTRSKEHQKAKVLGVTIENDRAHWGCNHCGWTGPERGNGNGRDRDRAGFETYDYCDADGTLKFQKVRNPPGSKTRFWMRRPDSHGGWINDTKGVDTNLLYRIEEMNEAIALGRTVLVVEGEKDVNNLWRIGIPAICNAHGASEPGKQPKWTKAHSEQLRGADIVVMPDHDAAGYAHADAVCKTSLGTAKRVRVLKLAEHWPECPKGGDISDWLAAGHTCEELDALTAAAPDYVSATARREKVQASEGAPLLDDVREFLARFVVYPSDHAQIAHVLWIAHAHLMDAWESTPRIAFLSPEPASGKTRSMEVSELLVPNPVAAVNVTPAYLFRKVGSEDGPPTILFDEIDTVFGPKAKENEEIRALLNSGHRRGAVAGRCVVRGKTVETEEISSYAAVALAGLGWLPDTILSRSVIVRMRRRAPDEIVEPFRRRVHAPIGEALRRRLAGWAAAILKAATEARPQMPDGVEDRNADIWGPLLAVAEIAGSHWVRLARKAAAALVAVAREVEPSLNVRLLADLRTVFGAEEQLATKKILAELCLIEDAPWGDMKGKPITDNQLARRLKNYGVKSKTIRLGNDRFAKGYVRAELHDVWRRYLPRLPSSDKDVTGVTPVTEPDLWVLDVTPVTPQGLNVTPSDAPEAPPPVTPSREPCDGSADREKPHEMGLVTPVTPVTPSAGNRGDEPGLSRRRIQELADWYSDKGHQRCRDSALDTAEFDAELRAILRKEVAFPEHVEIEFERVMQVVFAS